MDLNSNINTIFPEDIWKKCPCLFVVLTHWGRVTHICIGKLIIIGSDNGLSPDRRQAIIWTNAALLSIGPLRTYFSENLIKMQQFSLKKMHVKMSSAKWRLSCLSLNVLMHWMWLFCYGFHISHSIPDMCSCCIYCLIIIPLMPLQWINKTAIVYQW